MRARTPMEYGFERDGRGSADRRRLPAAPRTGGRRFAYQGDRLLRINERAHPARRSEVREEVLSQVESGEIVSLHFENPWRHPPGPQCENAVDVAPA